MTATDISLYCDMSCPVEEGRSAPNPRIHDTSPRRLDEFDIKCQIDIEMNQIKDITARNAREESLSGDFYCLFLTRDMNVFFFTWSTKQQHKNTNKIKHRYYKVTFVAFVEVNLRVPLHIGGEARKRGDLP